MIYFMEKIKVAAFLNSPVMMNNIFIPNLKLRMKDRALLDIQVTDGLLQHHFQMNAMLCIKSMTAKMSQRHFHQMF
jgi:SRSO17 transposase